MMFKFRIKLLSELLMMLLLLLMMMIAWLGSPAEGRSLGEGNSRCQLGAIPLQKDFDLKQFQGKWYGTQKLGAGDSALSLFTEIYDVRMTFLLKANGDFDLKAVGSKFYGSWCPKGKGYSSVPSTESPERMTMYFDTRIGRKVGMKPAWLLKTDYKNYAVIYSCWKETPAGTCQPSSTYVGVLQRSTKELSNKHRAEVTQALKGACVDPSRLSKITHYGYCVEHEEI